MLNRRRFFSVLAATSAFGLSNLIPSHAAMRLAWRGVALGADAQIVMDGDTALGGTVISGVIAELSRLENIFSLYRHDSQISRLNREGRLERPDPDFLALLSLCDRMHDASRGAFDPTIQPVWSSLAAFYSGNVGKSVAIPSSIGWRHVAYSPERIEFEFPGMAITLNGIAQGYITDRIARLLAWTGFVHVLVDMGEMRAVANRADDRPWPVKLRNGISGNRIMLDGGRALAVSYSHGTTLDGDGQVGHLIDPHSGKPLESIVQVAVEANTAAVADGLSTALCVAGHADNDKMLRAFPGAEIVDWHHSAKTGETG